jgi:hypothetical protein
VSVGAARSYGDERGAAIRGVREEWRQLRRATEAGRPEGVMWRLDRIRQAKRMHNLTLAELLVASGCIR